MAVALDALSDERRAVGTFIADVAAPVQDPPALFNFDGSGGVNIFDVQALLDEG